MTSTPDLWNVVEEVSEVLVALGGQQRRWRTESRSRGQRLGDLAREADRRSSEQVGAALRARFPDAGVVGEECEPYRPDARVVWVVDPLDGTRNYSHGLSIWGISVARLEGDRPTAGVFHLPDAGETFAAVAGEGARLSGAPLRTPEWPGMGRTDLVTVGGFDFPAALKRGLIRRLGCAGAELCYLGAGRVAGVHLSRPWLWDVAAAALIAEEAGCRVARADADSLWPWPVSNMRCAAALVGWGPGIADPRD